MDELVQKLGYLDYRDLLAAYRYVLEAKRHQDYKIRTRAELLNYALKKMNMDKIQKIKERAEQLKKLNPTSELEDVGSTNQEQFIKFTDEFDIDQNDTQLRAYLQDPFLRKVYKEIYITQKASSQSERQYFEKKYKQIQQLSDHATQVMFQKKATSQNYPKDQLDKEYFSKLVEGLKPQTRKKLGLPNKYDSDISDEEFARVWRQWKQYATPVIISENQIKREQLLLQKQMSTQSGTRPSEHQLYKNYSRIINLKQVQNIPFKLRRDMIELRRAYQKSRLKMEDVMKEDPFFDTPPIDEDHPQINQIQDNSIIKLNSIARGLIFPQPGKYHRTLTGARDSQLAKFENKFKKKYFEAKFRFYCSKVLRKYDRILSGEASQVELYKPSKDSKQKMQLMREYMYQNIDWSSDRSRIRKKLLQNRAARMTLKDIGKVLDQFIIKDKMDSNEDVVKIEEQSKFKKINKPLQKKEEKWTDDIMKNYKTIKPLFLDNVQELDKILPEDKQTYKDVISQVKKKQKLDQLTQSKLSDDQKYEIELFHAFKTDPYFQHYLKYDKEKFEEERKQLIVEPPSLELKAIKLKQFLKFNSPKKITFLQDLSEKSYKRVVINGNSFGSGIRKSCKAFAIVRQGDGKITVNGKSWIKYFPQGAIYRNRIIHAILLSNLPSMVNIDIRVKGGGVTGQSQAIRLAVSRALANYMPAFRQDLQKAGYLKTDPRKVESKKIGKIKARKSQVYRRR